jgi:hypothetical protein
MKKKAKNKPMRGKAKPIAGRRHDGATDEMTKDQKREFERRLDTILQDSLQEAPKKIIRKIIAQNVGATLEDDLDHEVLPEHEMLYRRIVDRLASHAGTSKAGKYVLQKIYDEIERLESKRPVRKTDLFRAVMTAYADLVYIAYEKTGTRLKDIKKMHMPTHAELYWRVVQITGWPESERLQRNVRLWADIMRLKLTPWKGS